MLAFVIESCAACQRLLADVSSNGSGIRNDLLLVAKTPSQPFVDALDATGVPYIRDAGDIWEACEVSSTPLVVRIDGDGRVLAKGVTHRVDSLAASKS